MSQLLLHHIQPPLMVRMYYFIAQLLSSQFPGEVDESLQDSSSGVIVGIVIAILLAVLIVIFLAYIGVRYFRKRRIRRKK